MDSQLLIHEMAVPVSAERHGDWSLKTANDFGFCASVNSVPLMTVEFFNAASEYAIVFSETDEGVMPSVMLGLDRDENRYLSDVGGWQARYVPAFVRRYPFVYSLSDDGRKFELCVDESFPHFNIEGRGERLFTSDKNPSPYLGRMLRFLEQYQLEFERTRSFCDKLLAFGLLEPICAEAATGKGESLSLDGLMAVNRDKARSLAADKLSELARSDEFGLLQLQLHSMRNFPAVIENSIGKALVSLGHASVRGSEVASSGR
ncbi:MAG TPA: SapC family protein [Burkholderiales bacterium]|nr:SapC family protein [Burkholderiales bacterium]